MSMWKKTERLNTNRGSELIFKIFEIVYGNAQLLKILSYNSMISVSNDE